MKTKTLKFRQNLAESVLSGKKNSTWRLFDDKDLTAGDVVSFLAKETLAEFARAEIVSVRETTFGQLTEKDWEGHGKYASEKEMYETYFEYYKRPVSANSPVKIINSNYWIQEADFEYQGNRMDELRHISKNP